MGQLPHLAASETLGDQAYAAIRDAIVSGDLVRGQKVTERGLAESLDISATPVREALRRLEQDRLVERTGPRSVRIAKFAAEELREFTLIGDSLRALAARLAAEKSTAAERRAMRAALDGADALLARAAGIEAGGEEERAAIEEILERMRAFHALVDRASGNATLLHMLDMVDAFGTDERRGAVLSEIGGDRRAAVEERYRQHRAIYEAIASGDGDLAAALMGAHSRAAGDSLIAGRFPA
ncbi:MULTISPECIES: GntR family transcriptional regulator [unclassified Streptomyces]|uniref:GntR family transcriptional regulator n=2 Tax=Streptomyces TaxID=1883 RepID=A0ABU2R7E4_9ACTN|nr:MULTISPECIES: GntR family transcriptional regulator [unclassified Streptomyces]MDT0412611.1 GntR family transcriptional regulator [Streptomyces sp. DSM 41979]MDT0421131.1 GntR family transcriptional regulator [Streptomyces sp. DSM 41859]MYQ60698.1 GntR family transcriptional regulator [Streptomyces sp. SID4926]WEH30968.1 GntR family transcriptional regulator [Streptomyces sp. AM 3-1-1]SCE54401.1 DNA-binding transcriptional regulator, GntR family [Streptomyces sp. DfronAA-171]